MEKQTLSSQESREADLEAKISEIMLPLLELSSLDLDFADLVIKNVTLDYGCGNNPLVAKIFMEVFLKIKNDPELYTFFSDCIGLGVKLPSQIIFLMELLGFDLRNKDLQRNKADIQFSDDQKFLQSLLSSDIFTTKKLGIPPKNPLHQRSRFTPSIDLSKALQTQGGNAEKMKAGFQAGRENRQKEQAKSDEIKESWEGVIDRLLEIVDRHLKPYSKESKDGRHVWDKTIFKILKDYKSLELSKWIKDHKLIDKSGNLKIISIINQNLYTILQTELRHKRKYEENSVSSLKSLVRLVADLLPIFQKHIKYTADDLKIEKYQKIMDSSTSQTVTRSAKKLCASYPGLLFDEEEEIEKFESCFVPEFLLPQLERRGVTPKLVFAKYMNDFMNTPNPLVDRVVELYQLQNEPFLSHQLKTQTIKSTAFATLVANHYMPRRYIYAKEEITEDLLFAEKVFSILRDGVENKTKADQLVGNYVEDEEYSARRHLRKFYDFVYHTIFDNNKSASLLPNLFKLCDKYTIPRQIVEKTIKTCVESVYRNPIKYGNLFEDLHLGTLPYNYDMGNTKSFYYKDEEIWLNPISLYYALLNVDIEEDSLAYQILGRICKDYDKFPKFYDCSESFMQHQTQEKNGLNQEFGSVSEPKDSKINQTPRLLTLDTPISKLSHLIKK